MADAFSTGTTAASFIPELWSKECLLARESVLNMANMVSRWDREVLNYGDTLHIPNLANLAAGNISTSDGTIDAVTNTEALSTINITSWKGTVVNVLDVVKAQANQDLLARYSEKIGYSLGLIVEQDVLLLAASVTPNVGTFNTDTVIDADLRTAVQKLDDARVPFTDRHFVCKPVIKNAMFGIDKFVRYDAIAYPPGTSPIRNGKMGEIYGFDITVTPEVYKTGNNTSNLLFHRDWAGLAVQKNMAMVQFAKIAFSDRIGGSELYGMAELRSDHAVQIKS